MDDKVIERFWAKVNKTDTCWLWTACSHPFGYGWFGINGKNHGAHRVSWMIHHPDKPIGKLWVLHKCDNPPCVNPEHLFLGTIQDNVKDCYEKGRCGGGAPRGIRNANSKLTDADIPEIRRLARSGWSRKDIAKGYGLSEQAAGAVIHRRTWRHVA